MEEIQSRQQVRGGEVVPPPHPPLEQTGGRQIFNLHSWRSRNGLSLSCACVASGVMHTPITLPISTVRTPLLPPPRPVFWLGNLKLIWRTKQPAAEHRGWLNRGPANQTDPQTWLTQPPVATQPVLQTDRMQNKGGYSRKFAKGPEIHK